MSRFTDPDELRKHAEQRLAARRGGMAPPERQAARERLKARKEADGGPEHEPNAPGSGGEERRTGQRHFALGSIDRIRSMSSRYLLIIGAALICTLLALGIGIVLRTDAFSKSQADTSDLAKTEREVPVSDADKNAVEIIVPDCIDQGLAESFEKRAQDDPVLARIVGQIEEYGRFGSDNQHKLLSLSLEEQGSVPFVDKVLSQYPAAENPPYQDPVERGTIPRLYQWDTRWGFKEYSAAPFGLTGCCPTSLSMVYMGLTGKTDMTPGVLADLARDHGYMSEMNGTVGDFLIAEAPGLGLICIDSYIDASTLRSGLEDGYVYICNVGQGDFTEDGHFFVITGMADSETLAINDPYSSVRSDRQWNIDAVIDQTIALYAFKAV